MIIFAHNNYTIVADTYSTARNWGHKATLLLNNTYTLATHKITYYNRTWERYEYQSVIKGLLSYYISSLVDDYINDYKQQNSINRLSQKLRQQLTEQAYTTPQIKELNNFYGEL